MNTSVLLITALALGTNAPAAEPTPTAASGSNTKAVPVDVEKSESTRDRILVLELVHGEAIKKTTAQALVELAAAELSKNPQLEVFAQSDLQQMIELEGEKQAIGCESNSCLAEIAGAMGARYVLFGSIRGVGSTTIVNLRIFDAHEAKPVSRTSFKANTIDHVVDAIPKLVNELVVPLGFAPAIVPPVEVAADTRADADAAAPSPAQETEEAPEQSEVANDEPASGVPWLGLGAGLAAASTVGILIAGGGALVGNGVYYEKTSPGWAKSVAGWWPVAAGGLAVASAVGLLTGGSMMVVGVLE